MNEIKETGVDTNSKKRYDDCSYIEIGRSENEIARAYEFIQDDDEKTHDAGKKIKAAESVND